MSRTNRLNFLVDSWVKLHGFVASSFGQLSRAPAQEAQDAKLSVVLAKALRAKQVHLNWQKLSILCQNLCALKFMTAL